MIGKKKLATVAVNPKHGTFVVHVVALSVDQGDEVHLSIKAQVAYLKVDEASIKVPSKFADFAKKNFPKLVAELPKHTRFNDHAIEIVDDR